MSKLEFWLLDINYDVVGGVPEIRMWGVDTEGRRVVVIDRSFRPYFYVVVSDWGEKQAETLRRALAPYGVTSLEPVEKRLFGRPVKAVKVTLTNPRLVPKARESAARVSFVQDVLEADIRFYMRYMVDNGILPSAWHTVDVEEADKPKQWAVDAVYVAKSPPKPLSEDRQPPPLRVAAFDIECYNRYGEPDPERDPVIIIGVADGSDVKLLTAEDKSDARLLREFVALISRIDPDVIVGYNSNRFDWPYLLERASKNHVKLAVTRAGGQPAPSVYGHYSVTGRANVDLYDYAEEIYEVKVKSLENVADYLGVMKKDERVLIDPNLIYAYWDDPQKRPTLLRYAEDDVKSTYGLAEKTLPFGIQLSSIVGLPLDQVFAASVGNRVEWHLIRQAYLYGELVPNRVERGYETYKGAIVLKPKPGVHQNVAVIDFSSMYPNIMIRYNVSPDTYVPPTEEVSEDEVWVAPEVGHRFRKHPPGFYKKVLERLLEARRRIRDKLKELDPESPEYRILYERQRAIKVIANATYGYCGWSGARWYKREVAEATTAWGRMLIRRTIEYARKLGLNVIYGDTDSVFVNYDPDKVEKLIRYVEEELGFEVKVDKVYKKVFFTEAKKRYCGLLEDGRIDVVGLEAVRGDWAEISKEVQEKVIEIVLKEGDPWKAVEYVKKVIDELNAGKVPLEKLIIWKTLTKELDSYEVDAPHVVAAKQLLEAGYRVRKGMKIGYIITKRGGEKVSSRAKPFFLVKSIDEVDTDYYIRRQIVPAALRILSYFGIKEEHILGGKKQASLFDFF